MVATENGEDIRLSIEQILPYVGEFGRYQKLLGLMMFFVTFPVAFQPVFTYFATIAPAWQCLHNSTVCKFNGTLSDKDDRRCGMQNYKDWTYTEAKDFSIVTQFDLNCKQKWILYLVNSMFFVGWGIGAIVLGWMADRYGRKRFIMACVAVTLLTGLVCPFMPSVSLIILWRFVLGFAFPGVSVQITILITEIVGNKHRPLVMIIPSLSYPIAWVLLGLKAYLLRSWKLLSIVTTVPYMFVLCFYALIPESVQWLHLNNRTDEAMSIFRTIARWNKRILPSNIIICFSNNVRIGKTNPGDIFRTRSVALQSFVQMYMWMALMLLTYGLQFASNDLEGSVYRDFVLLAILGIPANFLSAFAMQTVGRKKATLIPLLIAGAACLGIAWIPVKGSLKIARVALGIVGKLGVSTAIHTMYLWSAELYPTSVRGVALGVLQMSARVGAASSPWVVKGLLAFGGWIPFTFIAITTLLASGLGMRLPETKEIRLSKMSDQGQDEREGRHNIDSNIVSEES